MNLEKLLQYQKLDTDYIKIIKKLNSSPEAKNVTNFKNKAKEAKDELIKLDKEAGKIISGFDKQTKALNENKEKASEFKNIIEDSRDIKEIDYVNKRFKKIIDKNKELETDLDGLKKEISKIKTKTHKAFLKGKDSSEKYKEAIKKFDLLKKEYEDEIKKLKKSLKKIEKEIDNDDIMAKYKSLRKSKMPAIVKCENSSCTGCGMNVASDVVQKVKEHKEIECPNCGRFLYEKDEK